MFAAAEELRFEYAARAARRDQGASPRAAGGRGDGMTVALVLGSVGAGTVIGVLVSAFVTGGLARFAVRARHSMPIWLHDPHRPHRLLGGAAVAYAAGTATRTSSARPASPSPSSSSSPTGGSCSAVRSSGARRTTSRSAASGVDAVSRAAASRRDRSGEIGTGAAPFAPQAPPFAAPPAPSGSREEPTENPAHFLGLLEKRHRRGRARRRRQRRPRASARAAAGLGFPRAHAHHLPRSVGTDRGCARAARASGPRSDGQSSRRSGRPRRLLRRRAARRPALG